MPTETQEKNIDQSEVDKFNQLASRWWDIDGGMKALHDINPLRLQFIMDNANLNHKKVIDIGCGGGILTEGLAINGASATGIDASKSALTVARHHASQQGLNIDYQHCTAEDIAQTQAGQFDVVTCLEMLEHVPDPQSVIQACSQLVKPGGIVFFSTLNRNPKSYLQSIIGAEYILGLIPKGTHDYGKFIRPSELDSWARKADLQLQKMTGLTYNPISQKYSLNDSVDVNYLVCYQQKT